MIYGICLGRMGATEKQMIYLSLLFLGGIIVMVDVMGDLLDELENNGVFF